VNRGGLHQPQRKSDAMGLETYWPVGGGRELDDVNAGGWETMVHQQLDEPSFDKRRTRCFQ